MNDERIDEYLWDPQSPAAPEVAAIERLVGPCRFEPVPLVLATAETPAAPTATPPRARAWTLGLALAVAAAGLLWLLRPMPSPEPPPEPARAPEPSPPVEVITVLETPPAPVPAPAPVPVPEQAAEPQPASPKQPPKPRTKPSPPPPRPEADDATAPAPPPAPDLSLPDKLGPTDILDGVHQVRGPVAACGKKHQIAPGTKVSVKFWVLGATGEVESATVQESHRGLAPDHPAVPCIQTEARKAKFRRFRAERQGFTYKFKI